MKRAIVVSIILMAVMPVAARAQTFFTVGQEEGRWWFFDPDGERFFSMGTCVTTPSAFYAPDLGYAPYYQNIINLYGTEQAWSDVVVQRLADWNFNTLGAWSDVNLLGDRVPYTVNLSLSGSNWQYGDVPDYWGQDFLDRVADKMTNEVAPRANDPLLIGWFLDNELRWGPDMRGVKDMFAEYFAFPEDAPGKIAMVDWLRDRYGDDVAAFNLVWDLGILSFDELLPMTSVSAVSFDADKKADRAAFAGFVAERFFKTCHDAIRAADPNHLILGARFISWVAPREVVRAIVPYTDVVSVNHYMVFPIYFGMMDWLADTLGWMHVHDMLQEYYDETNLPVLITEFSIRALDAGVPSTWPPNWFFHTVQTQAERADFFENYARQTFRTGFIVGYHWFSYMDEPPEGRFDGENSNFGLVDNNDNPWTELTERMTAVNADAYVWPLADDDDDTADDDTSDDDTAGDDDTSSDDDSIFDDDGDDDDSVTDDDSSFDDDDDDSEADDDTTPGDNLAAASGDDDDGGCCG